MRSLILLDEGSPEGWQHLSTFTQGLIGIVSEAFPNGRTVYVNEVYKHSNDVTLSKVMSTRAEEVAKKALKALLKS